MRLSLFLVVWFVVGGCGATQDVASPLGSSGSKPAATAPTTQSETEPAQRPAIVLRSENGDQEAAQGSLCIFSLDPGSREGEGSCGDSGPIHPDAITGIAAGDEVALVFEGANVVRASGCEGTDEPVCVGSISVKPLGCGSREVESVPLVPGPETRWTVDLEPGAYELDVFAYFESNAGPTGDVTGTLGLSVAGGKKWDALGVFAVDPSKQVCKFD